ncbi:MAG: beta-N-acetylhexosaminidase [Acidobacteriia bacterium]|nr:beta-N-acetylhexosaminidase [Terriglobia bacterium]
MTTKSILALFVCLFSLRSSAAAQSSDPVRNLHLLPAPKEVSLGQGSFVVGPGTRIWISAKHASEDTTAAETLAAEIAGQAGIKVPIVVAQVMPAGPGSIVLGRLQDRSVRAALEARGLKAGDAFHAQGYLLFADKSRILVAGESGQGLFYGVQTLRQLLRPSGKQLRCPGAAIRDWPSMEWRGAQNHLIGGPIPRLDYVKKQIRVLASYKMNMFVLYLEGAFDYQQEPLTVPKEAVFQTAEVKELVEYARKYYVTVVPEQQSFSHLHHLLKLEIYNDLAETPHGQVLAPANEKSYQLLQEMYAELVPLFPGPFLHIGADETWELGNGQSKQRAAEIGLGQVYLGHLLKLNEMLKPYNKRLLFWGDVAVEYPELLRTVPKEMIAVPWNYNVLPSFDAQLKPFREAGLDVIVAPSTVNWNRIWPDVDRALVNIRNFVRDGQKYGALGMLNTTWDDDGEALFEQTWPGQVFGAAAGWQPGESSLEAFKDSYDWAFYRNGESTFRDAIEKLNRATELLNKAGFDEATDALFWADPFTEEGARTLQKGLPVAREVRLEAEHALESLYRNRARARAHGETVEAMILAAWRLDVLGMKIQFTGEMNRFYWDAYQNATTRNRVIDDLDAIGEVRLQDLREATTRMRALYQEAWLREAKPYWLANILLRYDILARTYETMAMRLASVEKQYNTTKTLPAPEQMGFYLKPE